MQFNIKNIFQSIRTDQEQYRIGLLAEKPRFLRAFHYLISYGYILYKEIIRDRLFARASALAYTTMLSLIPVLFVCGSIVLSFNKSLTVSDLTQMLKDYVNPTAGETIAQYLSENLARTLEIGTGPIGAVALIVTSVLLFIQIEGVFNDIWHVQKQRTFYLRILIFYAIITLGPIFLSISIIQAAQVFAEMPFSGIISNIVVTTGGAFMIFLLFKLLPSTKVTAKYVILPAIIVTLIFEILKYSFKYFVMASFASKYSILYGTLGLVPMVLVWIYVLWVVILVGVEGCFCAQNMRSLLYRCRMDAREDSENKCYIVSTYSVFEVIACLVRAYEKENFPINCDEIAEDCDYPTATVQTILKKLQSLGVIKEVESEHGTGIILVRPLEKIDLWNIFQTFDDACTRSNKHKNMNKLIHAMLKEQERILTDKNARSFLEIMK